MMVLLTSCCYAESYNVIYYVLLGCCLISIICAHVFHMLCGKYVVFAIVLGLAYMCGFWNASRPSRLLARGMHPDVQHCVLSGSFNNSCWHGYVDSIEESISSPSTLSSSACAYGLFCCFPIKGVIFPFWSALYQGLYIRCFLFLFPKKGVICNCSKTLL